MKNAFTYESKWRESTDNDSVFSKFVVPDQNSKAILRLIKLLFISVKYVLPFFISSCDMPSIGFKTKVLAPISSAIVLANLGLIILSKNIYSTWFCLAKLAIVDNFFGDGSSSGDRPEIAIWLKPYSLAR